MIGTLIRTERQRKGITQTDLARRTGLSQNYISKLEGGSIDLPQRSTLEVLGAALDLDLEDFYRAAGVITGDATITPPAPRTIVIPTPRGPEEHDLDQVVRFVESKPDRVFQAHLAEAREDMTRAQYEEWIADIYAAWTSNGNLAVRARRRGNGGQGA